MNHMKHNFLSNQTLIYNVPMWRIESTLDDYIATKYNKLMEFLKAFHLMYNL